MEIVIMYTTENAPVVPAEMLEKMVEIARGLKKRGEAFNDQLMDDTNAVIDEMEITIADGDAVPFELCIALTTSWLVYSGQATHAAKVLDVIQAGDTKRIAKLKHPRGHAVRLALTAWMPLTNTWNDDYCPSSEELAVYYRDNIHEHASWCRWGVLAPVKLYGIVNDWPRKDANRFVPPMGRFVRAALRHLFGLEIADPETTTGHHLAYRVQLHLAKLAGTSVSVINSGLWALGVDVLAEEGLQ